MSAKAQGTKWDRFLQTHPEAYLELLASIRKKKERKRPWRPRVVRLGRWK